MLFDKDGGNWNACVGDNGYQDDWKYYDGFSLVPFLCFQYIQNNNRHRIDSMVYPMVFSARHSIEIFIKDLIRKINTIRSIEDKEYLNRFIRSTHSIKNVWIKYIEIAEKTDRRFVYLGNKITPFIDELEAIDSEGQTFRYSDNFDGHKNLVHQGTINTVKFIKTYKEIFNFFENLMSLYFNISDEYKLNVFTKNLSRYDIERISKMLPPYPKWAISDDLDKAIELICVKFSISKNECSKAINIIKKHLVFKQNIQIYSETLPILKKEILLLIRLNKEYQKRTKIPDSVHFFSDDIGDMLERDDELIHDLIGRFNAKLKQDNIHLVEKIYYIGFNKIPYEYTFDVEKCMETRSDEQSLRYIIQSQSLAKYLRKGIINYGYEHELARLCLL